MLLNVRFFLKVYLISFALNCTADAPQTFSPAVFEPDDRSFEESVEWPRLNANEQLTVMLFCNYRVSKEGQIRAAGCRPSDPEEKRFIKPVEKALRKSKLLPAIVNGTPVGVLLFGRILIQCNGQNCQSLKIPNLGYHHKSHGADYMAPQMIDSGLWLYTRIWNHVMASDLPSGPMTIMFTARVDQVGNQSEMRLYGPPGRRRARIEKASLQALRGMTFIPGFHHGTAVSLDWYGWVSKGLLDD